MRKDFFLFFISLLLFCFTACSFEKLKVERISSIKIINIRDNQLELEITAVANNLNKISATLTQVNAEIFLNNKPVGKGTSDKEIKIKSNDTTSVTINVKLNLPQMNEVFPKILAEDSTLITVQGTFCLKKWFFSKTLKDTFIVYMNAMQELQKCLNNEANTLVKITGFKPNGIGHEATKFELNTEFSNPYPFTYRLEELKLDAVMENTTDTVGKIFYSTPIEMKPKSTQEIAMTADFLYKGFIQSIGDVLLGGARNIIIKGTATISINNLKFVLPVEKKQKAIPLLPDK
ncbi:MAG: LEA type 2 family protein [Bacteroidales bacterium]|nr:LEA type 2 family protein [Bacteroidales bacterium]